MRFGENVLREGIEKGAVHFKAEGSLYFGSGLLNNGFSNSSWISALLTHLLWQERSSADRATDQSTDKTAFTWGMGQTVKQKQQKATPVHCRLYYLYKRLKNGVCLSTTGQREIVQVSCLIHHFSHSFFNEGNQEFSLGTRGSWRL